VEPPLLLRRNVPLLGTTSYSPPPHKEVPKPHRGEALAWGVPLAEGSR
jgi:hypothetical protein